MEDFKSFIIKGSVEAEYRESVAIHICEYNGRDYMENLVKKWNGSPYPEMIRTLPEVDIQLKGIRGWLLQTKDKQVVFFDIQPACEVPPHSHCDQWGFVVEGEMRMVIGGKSRVYRKGDWYFIPEGVVHSAVFLTKVNAIDIFDDPQRYRTKR